MSKDIYILSPHIDDAAYALALTIAHCVEKKASVTIINCFSFTKWAIRFISKDINEIINLRKKEDEFFYKKYGGEVKIVNLDWEDAPLRNDYIWQIAPFNEQEKELVFKLKEFLSNSIQGVLFCPLGIGNHIDHAICRAAAVDLYEHIPIFFYEDLPYTQRISEGKIQEHIRELEKELAVELVPEVFYTFNCCFDKAEALKQYESQLNDEIYAEILARMEVLEGERIWGEREVIREI